MQHIDTVSLTEFARSLIARARAKSEGEDADAPRPFPSGTSPDSLRAASLAQAEALGTIKAKTAAEIDTLTATIDRLDVELQTQRGQLASVTAEHNDLLIEMSRLRADAKDLGDALVARLVAEFEQRAATLS